MDKVRVLEFYKISEQTYQSTCSAIGLKNPALLTGEQLDHFDRVRGWLDNKEVKNFKEASDRFQSEVVQPKAAPGADVSKKFEAITESKAATALETALNVLDTAEQTLQKTLLDSFYAQVLKRAQSPEFQERLRQSSQPNAQAIDAEYTVESPALPAPQP